MNSQNKNPVIDADAHVVECAHTWDFMDKSEEKYRPIPLEAREEAGVRQQFWLVDGKVRGFRFAVLSDELMAKRQKQIGRKFAEQQESRELANGRRGALQELESLACRDAKIYRPPSKRKF